MKTEIRMELTRDLQKMKVTSVGANAPWLFALGIVGEIVGGTAFIAASIRLTIVAVSEDRMFWVGYSILFIGIVLIGHAGYLMIKRSFNHRLSSLYQAVLESPVAQDAGASVPS
jgi:hypothetical protein